MNLRFISKALLFFATAIHSAVGTSSRSLYDDPKIIMAEDLYAIQGKYIVVLKDPAEGGRRSRALMEQTVEEFAQSIPGVKIKNVYHAAIQGFAAELTDDAAHEIAKRVDVDYIEQDAIVKADDVTWGIDRVDQRDLPLDNTFSVTHTGNNVYAYILDTGVLTTHEEFENRATWGTNTSGDGDDRDCHGHGTHVAGTVGGKEYGVAKEVNIVAVKVLTCSGSGSTSGVIAGVEWVQNDASGKKATANMSLGGGFSQSLNNAVANLHDSGVPTIVAAGNDNGNACSKSPASEPKAVTVGSTTSSDARSSFSNYGTCLDIFAPGSSITAAWIGSNTATRTISGTSMASPHVCGGAALLLDEGITGSNNIVAELTSRATEGKVTDPQSGSPNKLLYVGAVGPTAPPTPAPPTPAPTPCIGQNLEIVVTTDTYPAETSWELENECDDSIIDKHGPYTAAGTEHTHDVCLPQTGEFTFRISDTYGDGLCCSYGNGSYALILDGTTIKQGGQFTSVDSHNFGSCSSTSAPTSQPTSTPTKQPTSSPTKQPTSSPTKQPTSSPTGSPGSPTNSPTSSPTTTTDCSDSNSFFSGNAVRMRKKTCQWLSTRNDTKKMKFCTKRWRYGEVNEVVYGPPMKECLETCNEFLDDDICDTCFQHNKLRFFWKVNGRGKKLLKNCSWLDRRSDKATICSNNDRDDDGIYPPVQEICPQICEVNGC